LITEISRNQQQNNSVITWLQFILIIFLKQYNVHAEATTKQREKEKLR